MSARRSRGFRLGNPSKVVVHCKRCIRSDMISPSLKIGLFRAEEHMARATLFSWVTKTQHSSPEGVGYLMSVVCVLSNDTKGDCRGNRHSTGGLSVLDTTLSPSSAYTCGGFGWGSCWDWVLGTTGGGTGTGAGAGSDGVTAIDISMSPIGLWYQK
ncbi:hypothetical protein B0I72DRAFT_4906 [Yarrowia lipolytica]|uniref:Uncharacterized protein n=1 Tax=Yarrowia lipolytica TaxID=4952 RepID=A0A371BYV7_YARLL|nr:hypothetical protein B0I71DRAFT_14957 [Yarrowia lipolytica]RDW30883.1 hypothetical protein B0I72DRAFT_4906 [Yarrowia lipolytica]RDW36366.1 hypothetical protein B0I73DRAFT_20218 [Yarrowia lipolytica]RDW42826.1 hypothetical protein B0I74DRAFT_19794 [Yarrowia lipolytica]RDW50099.1 hypothetical protein B0I75DRAFT_9902 [Yarrowia lipolytica]